MRRGIGTAVGMIMAGAAVLVVAGMLFAGPIVDNAGTAGSCGSISNAQYHSDTRNAGCHQAWKFRLGLVVTAGVLGAALLVAGSFELNRTTDRAMP